MSTQTTPAPGRPHLRQTIGDDMLTLTANTMGTLGHVLDYMDTIATEIHDMREYMHTMHQDMVETAGEALGHPNVLTSAAMFLQAPEDTIVAGEHGWPWFKTGENRWESDGLVRTSQDMAGSGERWKVRRWGWETK